MLQAPASLWNSLVAAGRLSACVSVGDETCSWGQLAAGSFFDGEIAELRGLSVLISVSSQMAAAAAMVQLDGIARRIVLFPPDVSRAHLAFVAETAEVDAVVTDHDAADPFGSDMQRIVPCGVANQDAVHADGKAEVETEWVLLTSGTTGHPKLVVHTLASLCGAIQPEGGSTGPMVWSTFYDIRRYGGLQIFLRAAVTGTPLVVPGFDQPIHSFLARAGALGVTHISGTPSHWRRALMSPSADRMSPAYARLSGEIADQAILNQLHAQYPRARIAHAFASTEAGVVFVVNDGSMGVPAEVVSNTPGVEMKIEAGTLRVRSHRTASRYLGKVRRTMRDEDGFVDTLDLMELRGGRYYFKGRRDGIINVGGQKVHPEEVESVINRHPEVSISLVKTKKNPITGALVVADVVLKRPAQAEAQDGVALQLEILQFCRGELALHKVPALINFVPALAVGETGKLIRTHA